MLFSKSVSLVMSTYFSSVHTSSTILSFFPESFCSYTLLTWYPALRMIDFS